MKSARLRKHTDAKHRRREKHRFPERISVENERRENKCTENYLLRERTLWKGDIQNTSVTTEQTQRSIERPPIQINPFSSPTKHRLILPAHVFVRKNNNNNKNFHRFKEKRDYQLSRQLYNPFIMRVFRATSHRPEVNQKKKKKEMKRFIPQLNYESTEDEVRIQRTHAVVRRVGYAPCIPTKWERKVQSPLIFWRNEDASIQELLRAYLLTGKRNPCFICLLSHTSPLPHFISYTDNQRHCRNEVKRNTKAVIDRNVEKLEKQTSTQCLSHFLLLHFPPCNWRTEVKKSDKKEVKKSDTTSMGNRPFGFRIIARCVSTRFQAVASHWQSPEYTQQSIVRQL